MTIKINGTNTTAQPSITGADTDTGLVYGTGEVSVVTDGTKRLKVDSSGNVGIGTSTFTAPSSGRQILEINGTASALINLDVGGTRKAYYFTDGTDVYNYNTANGSYIVGTNDTERLRIDSSGKVGIGLTSPAARLEVRGGGGSISGTPYKFLYATDGSIRVTGVESTVDVVSSATGEHASSILLRGVNEGFAFVNNHDHNRLDLNSFTASADSFYVHGNAGANVSAFTNVASFLKTGQLLVGATTVQAHPNMDDLQLGDGTGNRGLTISSGTSSYGTLAFGDSTDSSGNDRYSGSIEYYHADNSMRFYADIGERLRIQSGGGISFNGDSATANALDDYEEGTYTPALYAGTGTTEPSYNWRYGQYVKTGELVTVWGAIGINGSMPTCASAYIGNLPYAQVWNANGFFHYVQLFGYTWASGYGDSGNTTRLMLQTANSPSNKILIVSGSNKSNVTHSDIGTFQRFTFCVSYVTG